jgi:hypothetical protein
VVVYIVSVDGRASRKNIRPFLVVGATTMGQEGTYVQDIGRHPVPTANRTFYLSLHLSLSIPLRSLFTLHCWGNDDEKIFIMLD